MNILGAMISIFSKGEEGGFLPTRYITPTPPKKPRKCLLPGCNKLHTNNNAYCCAEHCKQHREMMRKP